MPAESEHGLRVQLATALQERDGAVAERDAARDFANATRAALTAANARADAASTNWRETEDHNNDLLKRNTELESALAAARRENDRLRDSMSKILTMGFSVAHCEQIARAALGVPAAAAVRDPATEDADAAWRDGEAHGRDE